MPRCRECTHDKAQDEFGKAGRDTYRRTCKVCYNFKRRNEYDIAKRVRRNTTGRKAPEYYSFPLDVKVRNYHNVIERMTRFGIMSEEYAEIARRNVAALEESNA